MEKKILLSFIINIITIILAFTSLTPEIIKSLNKNNVYQSFFGFFRFFTNDGNIYSTIVSCILLSYQITVLFFNLNSNILKNNYIYLLCLGSSVSEIIILLVVLFLLLPHFGLSIITPYEMINLHLLIPILITFRFIFLDKKQNNISILKSLYGTIPISIYGLIIFFLVVFKVFTKENNKIPYPFFEIYTNPWYFSFLSIGGIVSATFGLCILLNYLNEKLNDKLFGYETIRLISDVTDDI